MNKPNASSQDSRRTIQEPLPSDTGIHPHRTVVELTSTDSVAPSAAGAKAPQSGPPSTRVLPPGQTATPAAATTQPLAGTELGTYRLVELLGEGGMGAVWKAVHTKLKKTVAIKLLPAHLTRDPALVARFEREMEAVGTLDHPNIVRAMDAGEINGTHYLVMEYVDGLDLAGSSRNAASGR